MGSSSSSSCCCCASRNRDVGGEHDDESLDVVAAAAAAARARRAARRGTASVTSTPAAQRRPQHGGPPRPRTPSNACGAPPRSDIVPSPPLLPAAVASDRVAPRGSQATGAPRQRGAAAAARETAPRIQTETAPEMTRVREWLSSTRNNAAGRRVKSSINVGGAAPPFCYHRTPAVADSSRMATASVAESDIHWTTSGSSVASRLAVHIIDDECTAMTDARPAAAINVNDNSDDDAAAPAVAPRPRAAFSPSTMLDYCGGHNESGHIGAPELSHTLPHLPPCT